MMAAAVEPAEENASDAIPPIDALISTSEANLRDRAERMATRLSAHDAIATTRVADEEARITPEGRWRIPSRQVVVTHHTLSPDQWARKLADDLPAIAVAVGDDGVQVDLRWLDPAHDGQLAEALGRN